MRSSYLHVLSFYSHNETSLAIPCDMVPRDISLHNFDGLAMSGLAFSVAPWRR